VGEIKRADIWCHEPKRTYEVVCSFGLIEHFVEWPQLLARHARLVQNKGYLVVSTPNFRGWIQRMLHVALDLENYRRHNISAMSPRNWGRMVGESGFRIIDCGWFGRFDFWADHQPRNIFQKATLKIIHRSLPRLKGLPAKVAAYAPYCGLVAQKALNETAA
jgi:cyclopropane fatty-acyl-phospholipid synthase-like methyltransferase